MTVMDTTDGVFMNLAYGWAFSNPVRKVYYNLAITSLSVAICFFIGGVEVVGLIPREISGLIESHGSGASWQVSTSTRPGSLSSACSLNVAGRTRRLAPRSNRGEVDRRAQPGTPSGLVGAPAAAGGSESQDRSGWTYP